MHIKWNGIIGDVNILKNCIMRSNLIKKKDEEEERWREFKNLEIKGIWWERRMRNFFVCMLNQKLK